MRECGNVGRRAMRCGAPAVTPGVSAQAGNARPRFLNYRTPALPHCHIVFPPPLGGKKTKYFGGKNAKNISVDKIIPLPLP